MSRSNTLALVEEVKAQGQDFEWYPTTGEILAVVKSDMAKSTCRYGDTEPSCSVLDCGAGDGRSLKALTKGQRYAIEKSRPLIQAMPKGVMIVGTDFHQQTLMDKKVDVVFCNPPYSEFLQWSFKILQETRAGLVYMVMPTRWKDSPALKEVIEDRGIETRVLGTFDFLKAERAARAEVDIVRFNLGRSDKYREKYGNGRDGGCTDDPFKAWFDKHFSPGVKESKFTSYEEKSEAKESVHNRYTNALVDGRDQVTVLEKLYHSDMEHLIKNYTAIKQLDPELISEMGVDMEALRGSMRSKIETLKDSYWREFFDTFSKVTDRLCRKQRSEMLGALTEHTHIDFSAENAYAVTCWVVKNANTYYEDQLCELFERMLGKANIKNYKSNQRTYRDEDWRWGNAAKQSHIGLELRIILESWNYGISYCNIMQRCEGLSSNGWNLLQDVRTVANNLGYRPLDCVTEKGETIAEPLKNHKDWEPGKNVDIYCKDRRTGEPVILVRAKPFKNGNMHLKFNQDFMMRFNVEFGRLKGWLKDHSEAASELDLSKTEALSAFGSNKTLLPRDTLMAIGFDEAEMEGGADD